MLSLDQRRSRLFRVALIVLVIAATVSTAYALKLTPFQAPRPAHAQNNGGAPTPPLGWDIWNYINQTPLQQDCNPTNTTFNETYFKQVADALVSTGLRDAGYKTMMLACNPFIRDSSGHLQGNTAKFPDGITAMVSYIHNDGLKAEAYTDVGTTDCTGGPGAHGHEQDDANSFAAWGFDAVKEDWCNSSGIDAATAYRQMSDALKNTGRQFWLEACDSDFSGQVEKTANIWGPRTANFWRTGPDVDRGSDKGSNWADMTANLDLNEKHPEAQVPGSYNYPDMLETGVTGGLNDTEQQTMFTMWAEMGSPIILGMDVRSLSATAKAVVENSEVLAVDQDPLAVEGVKVSDNGSGLQVYSKRLQGSGTRAVVLLNRSGSAANITANWSDLGLAAGNASVRDLYAHSDLGSFTNSYTTNVPSHAAVMLKLSGTEATPAPLSVDDGVTGSGQNQFSYSGGGWGASTSGAPSNQYDGTHHWDNIAGDSVSFAFTGTTVRYYGLIGTSAGQFDVYLDSNKQTTIDAYSGGPDSGNELLWSAGGLSNSNHTLKIVVTGNKNLSATNSYVNVDRVEVLAPAGSGGGTTTVDDSVMGSGQNQFNYTGSNWTHCASGCMAGSYNNTVSLDDISGEYATITFTGTQIKFYTDERNNRGIAGVSLDGGSETNVDLYAANDAADLLVWISPTLSRGTHTLKIRNTGMKNSQSSGTRLAIDRVDILP